MRSASQTLAVSRCSRIAASAVAGRPLSIARSSSACSIRLVLESIVFGAAALARAAADQPTLAIVFAVIAAISGTLNYVWDSAPYSVRSGP
jgi:hypothetical protein